MSRCAGKCAAPIRSVCLLSGASILLRFPALAARALAEKNERLAAFTGVPRRGFDGAVPAGHYADETPYVEDIARAVGNIDVTYLENDRCKRFCRARALLHRAGRTGA